MCVCASLCVCKTRGQVCRMGKWMLGVDRYLNLIKIEKGVVNDVQIKDYSILGFLF